MEKPPCFTHCELIYYRRGTAADILYVEFLTLFVFFTLQLSWFGFTLGCKR